MLSLNTGVLRVRDGVKLKLNTVSEYWGTESERRS